MPRTSIGFSPAIRWQCQTVTGMRYETAGSISRCSRPKWSGFCSLNTCRRRLPASGKDRRSATTRCRPSSCCAGAGRCSWATRADWARPTRPRRSCAPNQGRYRRPSCATLTCKSNGRTSSLPSLICASMSFPRHPHTTFRRRTCMYSGSRKSAAGPTFSPPTSSRPRFSMSPRACVQAPPLPRAAPPRYWPTTFPTGSA